MDTTALTTMIVTLVLIWGGLAASIGWAVHVARRD